MSVESEIKQMLMSAFTYTQIAKHLRVTKSTISGKIARMRKRGEIDYMHRPVVMRAEPEDPIARAVYVEERFTFPVSVEGRWVTPPEGTKGVHLLDLNSNDCRYSVAMVQREHFFCGKPRASIKTSYCDEHHKLVWSARTSPQGNKPAEPTPFRLAQPRRFGDVL